jgi:hypothetical protein
MALINHRAREIHFKLVYYGPGLGGKTTNLQLLHQKLPPERRGRLISIATDQERTLFFDFLPIELGRVNDLVTRIHLYTVPGQVYYRLSRRAVLQGADGIVFVADSHPAREQSNRESLLDLEQHLTFLGLSPEQMRRIPRVFQYNKRDLPQALPVARMSALLNPGGAPEFEAVAREGRGVSETLRTACKLVLARLAGQPAPAPSTALAAPHGTAETATPKGPMTSATSAVGPVGSAGAQAPRATLARPPAAPLFPRRVR